MVDDSMNDINRPFNDSTEEDTEPKESEGLIDTNSNASESVNLYLPNGLRISITSNTIIANSLCDIAMKMIKSLDIKKTNGSSYTG